MRSECNLLLLIAATSFFAVRFLRTDANEWGQRTSIKLYYLYCRNVVHRSTYPTYTTSHYLLARLQPRRNGSSLHMQSLRRAAGERRLPTIFSLGCILAFSIQAKARISVLLPTFTISYMINALQKERERRLTHMCPDFTRVLPGFLSELYFASFFSCYFGAVFRIATIATSFSHFDRCRLGNPNIFSVHSYYNSGRLMHKALDCSHSSRTQQIDFTLMVNKNTVYHLLQPLPHLASVDYGAASTGLEKTATISHSFRDAFAMHARVMPKYINNRRSPRKERAAMVALEQFGGAGRDTIRE